MALPISTLSQERCGTMDYERILQIKYPERESRMQFESWLYQKKQEKENPLSFQSFLKTTELVVTIPVVVHVIHNGEEIGTGTNISVEQIKSQIEVINEDFRRMNRDTTDTPAQFKSVASDPEIEFVLAKQDPEGLPTDGIVRFKGSKRSWSFTDNSKLKSHSYWPAEDYLNIWVAPLTGGLLGYAQFPVSNLEGLEDSPNNRLTDGIVVESFAFGSILKDPDAKLDSPYDLGRTATHEIGHFLGLRHIWGDGDCSADDFCDDTPLQANSTTGCPENKNTCNTDDMFQNYMDFTDDGCMNLFTSCQKERMRIVLDNSPRRESLVTSIGDEEPVIADNDAGIRQILSPEKGICQNSIVPSIEVRNYGNNFINTAEIDFILNGNLIETVTPTLNLDTLETGIVNFSPLELPLPGNYNFTFQIKNTNDSIDTNTQNNADSIIAVVPEFINLPFTEVFDSIPQDWTIKNTDNRITWDTVGAAKETGENKALYLNYFNYDSGLGEFDSFISPEMSFTGLPLAKLFFNVAYAQFPGVVNDILMVAVSTDCGKTFNDIVYEKSGNSLATTDQSSLPFFPSSEDEWRAEIVDLSSYIGESSIMIAFIGQNGFGNNIFIDDISMVIDDRNDISLTSIQSPSLISCNNNPSPVVEVYNAGTAAVRSLSTTLIVNDQIRERLIDNEVNILPGESEIIEFAPINLEDGESEIRAEVNFSDGNIDFRPADNSLAKKIKVDSRIEIIPTREKFESPDLNELKWTSVNPDNDLFSWRIQSASGNGPDNYALLINNFGNSTIGTKDLFASPILDLSNTSEAGLFFKISHGNQPGLPDNLKVLASTDCGNSYPYILYDKSGSDLAVRESSIKWIPQISGDWRKEFVDLSMFAGEPKIRLLFQVENGNGNDIYLDDIELFVSNNPNPVETSVNTTKIYPNPSDDAQFNVTFNLEEKDHVDIVIYNSMGKFIWKNRFNNVLNQTFNFNLKGNADGIYLMKVTGNQINEIHRIFIKY